LVKSVSPLKVGSVQKKQVTFCKGLDFRASLWNTLGINQTIENKGYAIFKTRR